MELTTLYSISDLVSCDTSVQALEAQGGAPSGLFGSAGARANEVDASLGAKTCFPFAGSASLLSELSALAFPLPLSATGAAFPAVGLRFLGGSLSELGWAAGPASSAVDSSSKSGKTLRARSSISTLVFASRAALRASLKPGWVGADLVNGELFLAGGSLPTILR